MPHPPPERILTAEAMRAADRFTIEEYGLPSFTLMESAGRAAADAIAVTFGPLEDKTVAVFCGKGNNGGDGLVVARQLLEKGARLRVVLTAGAEALSEDAAHNLGLLETWDAAHGDDRLTFVHFENLTQLAAFRPADVHVDALLGTGLTSDLRAPVRGLVGWMNAQSAPAVALDVPTGLHSDTGQILGDVLRAALTVTMGARKAGLLLGDGPDVAGRVEVAEIGLPAFALEQAQQKHPDGCAHYPTDAAVRTLLPRRPRDAYKYSVGLALVVAGSPGMTGAPVMASTAAARAGAGYVACACPEAAQPTLAAKLTEITTVGLPASETPASGAAALDVDGALAALSGHLEKARALLVGPGLGRQQSTQRFIRRLLEEADVPAVVDADGLNALAALGSAPEDTADWIAERADGRWILTPHAGEFKRLAGEETDLADRLRTAQRYARRWNAVLLLKGTPALVAAPDGTAYVSRTGNAALATAGTGDVLAGFTAGLLAQGLAPAEAALCALHLGGAAADRYAEQRGARSMMATDLLEQLPLLLRERFS